MSSKKHNIESKSKKSLFGEPDTVIPERENKADASIRDIVSSIVRTAWAKAQEWTVAWKAGGTHLKAVVEAVINLQQDEELAPLIHEAALQLRTAITKMEACAKALDELLQNLRKIKQLQSEHLFNQPLFSTLTMHHIGCVLESVYEDYKKETDVKAGVCAILPSTHNVDTLNTAVTLWTHHTYLVTHQFPLKSLLRETQQM